jgi:hypothetical protein
MTLPPPTLSASPQVLPHTYDLLNDAVYAIALTEPEYRAASFLDARLLTPDKPGVWLRWAEFEAAITRLEIRPGCDFIFHISHVGSTLLSRLLGAHPEVFALREPAPLRVLALAEAEVSTAESPISPAAFAVRLATFVKAWSRTWTPDQRSLLKATSYASPLAAELMGLAAPARAILMYVTPEAFLASILPAPNSPLDIRAQAQERLRRLHARLGRAAWRLHDLSIGEMTAMTWACEMIALRDAARGRETSVVWVEFDRFLADPQTGLSLAFAHLDHDVPPGELAKLIASPLMRQYSKAPEHAYDRRLRQEVLQAGRQDQGAELRRGLDWLQAAAAFPEVADALEFAAQSSG